jgi:prophage maintenance system killer protein
MKIQPFETGNKRTALLAAGLQCAIAGRGMLVDREGMLERAHRKVVEGRIGEERLEEVYRVTLDMREGQKEEVLRGLITEE